jgi:hypothetical protein
MVQAIFGLTQITSMMYSKDKPTISFNSVVEDKNIEND